MKLWFRSLFGVMLALGLTAAAHAQILAISSLTVDNAAPKPGDPVAYTITVINNDTTTGYSHGNVDFTLSLTNQVTGQVITFPAATVAVPDLAAGDTTTVVVSQTIPVSTSQAGSCKVTVVMSSVGSASYTTPSALVVITGKPDLAITSLTYPAGTAYKGGDIIPMSLTYTNLTNSGVNNVPYVPGKNGDASFFRIEVILSSNPTFGDGDDFLLATFDVSTRQDADNAVRTFSWNQLLPGNYAGSYYVMAKIDTESGVSEAIDNDLSLNGNNTWFDDTNAARINLLPTNFPTDYWASATGNGYSDNPALSSDGRYVAFASDSTNLGTSTLADTNNVRDIFLYDNQTATVRRINLSQQGAQANGASATPAISSTGRYVAFSSEATNLVVGDTNGFSDIYVMDTLAGTISLASVTSAGAQANGSNFKPSISADGTRVVFESSATNLASASSSTAVGVTHIYLRDLAAGTTVLVDQATGGAIADGSSLEAAISADGSTVTFASDATNLVAGDGNGVRDIFVRNLAGGTTVRVSVSTAGTEGNGASHAPSVSKTGRFIAFGSTASNLIAGDTNGVSDIFVYDRDVSGSGTFDTSGNTSTTRVSVSTAGVEGTDPSNVGFKLGSVNPSISSDGRYVTFASLSNNLAAGDSGGQTQTLLLTGAGDGAYATAPLVTLSAPNLVNGTQATAVATLGTGSLAGFVTAVTITNPGSGYTTAPTVTFDNTGTGGTGAAATAYVNANGYVAGPDANDAVDVFVADRDVSASGTYDTPGNIATSIVSVNRFGYQTQQLLGVPSSAASDIYPVISADGRWVALPSDAENTGGLVHGATNRTSPDLNTFRDVFLHDRRTNALPNPSNLPSVTVAAQNPVLVNTAVSVTASATTTVTGSVISSVAFYVNGTLLGTSTQFPYSVTWTPHAVGTFTLSALATDNFGNVGVSTNVTVKVNAAPGVSITSPVTNSTVTVSTVVPITATATATTPNESITSVQFYVNGSVQGAAVTTPPYTINWTPVSSGSFSLTAVATDTIGTQSTSAAVIINVTNGAVTPSGVTLGLPATGATILVNVPQDVTATASPAAGASVTSVQFYANNVSLGTVSTFPYAVTWTPLTPGTYTVVAVLIDSNGTQTTSAAHTVTVSPGAPPTVTLTAPAAAAINAAYTLTATADAATAGATIASVKFYDNGQLIGTSTTFPYSVSWTPGATGHHTITARATDTLGNFTDDTATVAVAANQAPTVSAPLSGLGASAGVGLANTLTATATDPDGTVASVEFFANGVSLGAPDPTAPYSLVWTPRIAGSYNLTAVVTDNLGLTTTSATTTVTVSGGNAPTSITVTAPAQLAVNSSTTLSATATAATGTIASIQFLANGVDLGTDTTAPYSVTWTPTANGTYTITVLVTDTAGNQATGTATTTVAANQAPTVSAPLSGLGATPGVGLANTLTVTAVDPDGTVASVEFFANGVSLGAPDITAPYSLVWTPRIAGSYNLTAVVTDNLGLTTTSATTPVTVSGGNAPTGVVLTAPGSSAIVNVAQTLSATATAATGTIASVQFFVTSGATTTAISTDSTFPYTATWTPSAPGTYSLTALATDTAGNETLSSAVTVTVTGGTVPTVSITSPSAGDTVTINTTQTITANAIPNSGALVSVEFFVNGVSLGSDTQFPYSISWTPTGAGAYNLTAVATDTLGAQAVSSVVAVTAVAGSTSLPYVYLTSTPTGTNVALNTTVTISANAGDPDGTVTGVQFYVGGELVGASTAVPYHATWVPAAAGSNIITAVVTDNAGNRITSTPVILTAVAAVGSTPLAGIHFNSPAVDVPAVGTTPPTIDPFAPIDVTSGSKLLISAAGADSDGSIASIQFFANGTSIATVSASPYYTVYSLGLTDVTLVALVTDNDGNSVYSAPIYVHALAVANGGTDTVTLVSPADSTTYVAGQQIVFSATHNLGTVNPPKIDFYLNGQPFSTTTAAPYQTLLGLTKAGDYYVHAVVRSGTVTTVSAVAHITVTSNNAPAVSLTSPVTGTQYSVGTPLTLTTDASDSDGVVQSVQFLINGSLLSTDTTAPFTATWNPGSPGTYTIRALAIDDTGNQTISAAVTVTIVGNAAPVVAVTSPTAAATIAAGTVYNLTASASDSDGTVASVTFLANGSFVGTATTTPFTVPWHPTTTGSYNITALATDNLGSQSASAPVAVTVSATSAPTVNLTSPGAGTLPINVAQAIQATAGSASGAITSVQFTINGVSFGTDTTYPYGISWTPTAPGTYGILAIATDNAGNQVTSSVVNVTVDVGTPPSVSVSAPAQQAVNSPVTLTATAIATTSGASIASVQFFANGLSLGTDTVFPYTAPWTPVTPGSYTISAVAIDTSGNQATSTATTVVAANQAPVISAPLSSLGASPGVGLVNTISVASATDPDGSVTQVEFFANGLSLGVDTTAPYSVAWTPHLGGAYSLTAVATDNLGLTTTSATTTVNVSGGNAPVSLSVTVPAQVAVNTTTTVSATATAVTGTIASVQFFANGTPIGSSPSVPYSISWTPTANGTYTISALVTDTAGNQASATATTTVAANQVPSVALTVPGPAASIGVGLAQTLTATASDPDGTITSVSFLANGTVVGTATNAPYTVSWSPDTAGGYQLTAVATDNGGATTYSAPVAFTVTSGNAPSISITSPSSGSIIPLGVARNITVALGTSTSVITLLEYRINGFVLLDQSNPGFPASATWLPNASGSYILTVVATDAAGHKATSAAVTVTVAPSSASPSVTITSPNPSSTSYVGVPLTLGATVGIGNSVIQNVLFYANGIFVGTVYPDITTKNQGDAPFFTVNFTPAATGTYNFIAVATDASGNQTTSATVTTTVTAPPLPTVAVSSPVDGTILPVNALQTLTASVNTPGVSVLNVSFFVNNVALKPVTAYPWSTDWTPVSPGTYTVVAAVTTSAGTTITSAPVTYTVTAATPPSISLTNPANGDSLVVGTAQTIMASVTAGTSAVDNVKFLVNGLALTTVTAYPYTTTWTPANLGSYVLTAVVTDAQGNRTTSIPITVSASAGSAGATGISVISNGGLTTVADGSVVLLRADPSPSQGTITQIQFLEDNIALGAPVTSAPYTLLYRPTTGAGTSHNITAQPSNTHGDALAPSAQLTITVVSAIAAASPATAAINNPQDLSTLAIPDSTHSIAVSVNALASTGGFITKVELYIEGSLLGSVPAYPYTFQWTPTSPGTYHLVALAYDNHNNIVASTTSSSVTSTPAPTTVFIATPPVIAITAPLDGGTLTGGTQSQVTFNASSSNNYPLHVQLFQDDVYVGSASLSAGGLGSISYVPTQKIHYDVNNNPVVDLSSLYAIATDSHGFATKSVEVTNLHVTNGGTGGGTTVIGHPPTVEITSLVAGAAYDVRAPITLTADAEDSDPAHPAVAGNITLVEFFVNGQKVASLTSYPYSTLWTPQNLGTYAVTAKATDNDGNIVTSTAVTITVRDPSSGLPVVHITSPAVGATLVAGTTTGLTATATDDVNVASVQFYVNGQPFGSLLTSSPYNVDWTPSAAGSYTLVARATDNVGNQSAPDSRTITVTDNAAPTVVLSSPVSATTLVAGNSINLAATAADSDGTIASVRFLANNIEVGSVSAAPYTFTWTPGAANTYSVVAKATDNSGNVTTSAAVTVTVNPNVAPTVGITAPANGNVIRIGTGATITAGATDVDGTVASVQIIANGVVLATLTSAPYTTVWNPTTEGVYRLTAVATDNSGATTTSVPVTVMASLVTTANSDTVYAGTYAALGDFGNFTAMNLHGRAATFIGYVPATQTQSAAKTYFYTDVPIDASNSFILRDASNNVLISGTFSDTGVSGTFDNGRVTFVGPIVSANSATPVAAGFYSGSILGHYSSVLTGIVGLDGTITLDLQDGTFADAGAGTVDATGAFTINTRAGNKFVGKADPATGFLSGTLTGAATGSFAAALPSGNSISDGFLRNISTRGLAGTGNNILIAGFVVTGDVPKQILVRAIGPSMQGGLTGLLPDPQLQLFTSAGVPVAGSYNNDWAPGLSSTFSLVGAFPLTNGSKDAAVLLTLNPGVYSAQVSDVNGATGLALVELYDVDNQTAFSSQKMVNISTRGQVGTGNNILIAGFVVNGTSPKKVLVRGLGPAMAASLPGLTLVDPIIRIVSVHGTGAPDGSTIRENDNWEVGNDPTLVIDANTRTGAQPLVSGSKDAAILMTLPPGIYSAQLFGSNSGTGIGLIEVYEVP